MKRIKYYKNLYSGFLRIGFLTATQYPLDTFLMTISMIAREAATFLGVVAIANVAGGIGHWGLYQVALLFSMGAMIEALGQGFFDMIWGISTSIRKGELDVFLVRPAPPFLQLLGKRIHFEAFISLFAAFGVMVLSWVKLDIPCSISRIVFLVEFIICGTMINSSV
ncbi:MAG: ABC-2 family transporter protein [Lachnospiraceae bacterium]